MKIKNRLVSELEKSIDECKNRMQFFHYLMQMITDIKVEEGSFAFHPERGPCLVQKIGYKNEDGSEAAVTKCPPEINIYAEIVVQSPGLRAQFLTVDARDLIPYTASSHALFGN